MVSSFNDRQNLLAKTLCKYRIGQHKMNHLPRVEGFRVAARQNRRHIFTEAAQHFTLFFGVMYKQGFGFCRCGFHLVEFPTNILQHKYIKVKGFYKMVMRATTPDNIIYTMVENYNPEAFQELIKKIAEENGMEIENDDIVTDHPPTGRGSALYQGLKELCELTGVEWKSPHKVRHGHGVYGIMHAQTMAEYKALSQNMMHETVATTDKTYSVLANDEVGDIIKSFKP